MYIPPSISVHIYIWRVPQKRLCGWVGHPCARGLLLCPKEGLVQLRSCARGGCVQERYKQYKEYYTYPPKMHTLFCVFVN